MQIDPLFRQKVHRYTEVPMCTVCCDCVKSEQRNTLQAWVEKEWLEYQQIISHQVILFPWPSEKIRDLPLHACMTKLFENALVWVDQRSAVHAPSQKLIDKAKIFGVRELTCLVFARKPGISVVHVFHGWAINATEAPRKAPFCRRRILPPPFSSAGHPNTPTCVSNPK